MSDAQQATRPPSYIERNQYGSFCSVCGSHLSLEEDDWDTCDCCGGEGFPGDDFEFEDGNADEF